MTCRSSSFHKHIYNLLVKTRKKIDKWTMNEANRNTFLCAEFFFVHKCASMSSTGLSEMKVRRNRCAEASQCLVCKRDFE